MRRHLQACLPCRRYSQEVDEVRRLLQNFPRVEPPPSFEGQVWEQVCTRDRVGLWAGFLHMGRGYAWAATVLVSLAAGALAWHSLGFLRTPAPGAAAVSPAVMRDSMATARPPRLERPAPGEEIAAAGVEPNPARTIGSGFLRRPISSSAATFLAESHDAGVTFFIRDESSKEVRVMRVPPVVLGAQPILPSSAKLINADSEVF